MSEVHRVAVEIGGTEIAFETGKIAKQASGAVTVTAGDTIVLSTATTASLYASVPTQPTNTAQIDWTVSAASAARTGGLTTFGGKLQTVAGTVVTGTSYLGAVDPNGAKWWQGWTNYAEN